MHRSAQSARRENRYEEIVVAAATVLAHACHATKRATAYRGIRHTLCDESMRLSVTGDAHRNGAPEAKPGYRHGRAEGASFKIASDKTRQGYALRSTLKPAGYFFLPSAR
jgi:hypothetical protein